MHLFVKKENEQLDLENNFISDAGVFLIQNSFYR